MKIRFKKLHSNAKLPLHAKAGDAGVDLIATDVSITDNSEITYKTGLAVEIPEGYVGLLFMRSSVYKTDIILRNSVGVIDSGYRGEIMFKFMPTYDFYGYSDIEDLNEEDLKRGTIHIYMTAEDKLRDINSYLQAYKIGDRIGQLVVIPYVTIDSEFVEELTKTERNNRGYGSTGN